MRTKFVSIAIILLLLVPNNIALAKVDNAKTPKTQVITTKKETKKVVKTHVFYVSSQAKTKYYCDSDTSWKKLSKKNLLKYDNESSLKKDFPKVSLNKACK